MDAGGHRRLREAVLALALLLGVLHSSSCVHFEVKDKDATCILADLSANFTVEYEAGAKKGQVSFVLLSNATLDSKSTCGSNTTAPLLAILFGNNHSLSINFTKVSTQYQVDELVFAYNLSDKSIFPDSSVNGTATVSSKNSAISASINSTYHCSNPHFIQMGNVNITFHDVKLEAYVVNNTYSKTETFCKEDVTPTSPSPTKPVTTSAPVPTQAPEKPESGHYSINETSGKPCLLADMGLKLKFNYTIKNETEATYVYNVPKQVGVTGQCLNTSATLILFSDTVYLLFNFTLNRTTSQFYLGYVYVNTTSLPNAKDPKFSQDNGSLSFLQTAEHKSYKCNAEQTLQITSNFTIETYNLQIQAFGIEENKYGPAIECVADQNGMLVPIVVGAALAGLVLIVLIAYLIGRKRSHAGYQTI